MIEIVLCEDQIQHQKTIEKFLKEILGENNIEYNLRIYKSGEELLKDYPKNVDIFILDIQMEKINGMDVARKIREIDKNKPEIIFTTSLVEYIQEGYEVRAYRYLLKPLTYEIIERHLNECILNILEKSKNFLIINNKNKLIKIMLDDVLYMETEGRELVIHKINDAYKVKMSMRKLEKLLQGKKFFRCHNSFMVNLDKIECIDKNIVYINKAQIPVSKHRIQSLKKELTNILGAIIC